MSTTPPPDLKTRMAASYDAIAQTYYTTFVENDANNFRLKSLTRVLALLQEDASQAGSYSEGDDGKETVSPVNVLELGCGAGMPVTKVLLEHTTPILNVTANDISPAQIDLARTYLASYLPAAQDSPSSNSRLTLIPGDMTALTYPPSTFSAVLGFYSIMHLPRTEQTALMQKITTWLRPGGLFLANFPAEEVASVVNEKWMNEEKGWMYWSSWGEEGSVRMVEACGFELVARDISNDIADARFVWIIAKKK